MKQKTLLLIEDEEEIREMLRELLVMDGYAVWVACNGGEALAEIPRRKVADAILLDLMMPVMAGEEFLEKLAQFDEWKDVPVLVMTAASVTSRPARATALIRKPFRVAQIRSVLADLWQKDGNA